MSLKIDTAQIDQAARNLDGVALRTPLQKN